jgi:uncharacterized membrane protein YeaQ/YmgE (transglycosylase-associated protein family)
VRGPDGADGQREVLDSWPKYCSQRRVLAFAPENSATQEESAVEEQQVGWIAAIIIGGIAGWLAEQFMKSQMGLVMNIVLGIIGAAVASWLFGFLGITFAGWIGYLIAGFIGACILIAIARAFSGGFQQRT